MACLYIDNTDDYIENSYNINCTHVYYLFKIMADKLYKREKRSAMIVTSSSAFLRPMPVSIVYSAQKRFVTHLAQGMALELAKKIDVMSFNPGEVATKLIYKDKSQAGGSIISTEKAVECCFRDVGCTDVTPGAFKHELGLWNFANIPQWMLSAGAQSIKKDELEKHIDLEKANFEKARIERESREGAKPN